MGTRTVYRWNRTGHAPRVARLALFWLTRWGQSAVHTKATNDAIFAAVLARSLDDERKCLRAQLAHVVALADTGAANRPVLRDY